MVLVELIQKIRSSVSDHFEVLRRRPRPESTIFTVTCCRTTTAWCHPHWHGRTSFNNNSTINSDNRQWRHCPICQVQVRSDLKPKRSNSDTQKIIPSVFRSLWRRPGQDVLGPGVGGLQERPHKVSPFEQIQFSQGQAIAGCWQIQYSSYNSRATILMFARQVKKLPGGENTHFESKKALDFNRQNPRSLLTFC